MQQTALQQTFQHPTTGPTRVAGREVSIGTNLGSAVFARQTDCTQVQVGTAPVVPWDLRLWPCCQTITQAGRLPSAYAGGIGYFPRARACFVGCLVTLQINIQPFTAHKTSFMTTMVYGCNVFLCGVGVGRPDSPPYACYELAPDASGK